MGNVGRVGLGSFWQLTTIFVIRVSSSMAYAVFFSGLSLYLTQSLHFQKLAATAVAGLFLSLNYFLPIIGGVFATRVIEYKKLYCLGSFLSFLGCLELAKSYNLYVGLSLFLMNSMVCNVCLNMFVTSLYEKHHITERRVGFVWNFVGMNLGFLGGYFLTGFSTLSNNYTNLFYLMALLMLMSLLLAIAFIKEPASHSINRTAKHPVLYTLVFMICAVFGIKTILEHGLTSKAYITIASIFTQLIMINYVYRKSAQADKTNIIKFFGYSLLSVTFWSAYMLTPIAIMQFIQNDVNRVLFGMTFAPQWIVNIDSIVILLLAPAFAVLLRQKNGTHKSAITYFQFGFLASALGFFSLYIGLATSMGLDKISVLPILFYLIFLVLGEIATNPVGNALIGELIPESMRALMTGAWTMNIGIGGLIASYISSNWILPNVVNSGLNSTFSTNLSHTTLIIGAILLMLTLLLELALRFYPKRETILSHR